jgi:hypothetical protein
MGEPPSGDAQPITGKRAFVDAYGTPSIHVEKDGVTTFFIIAAIIADGDRTTELRSNVDAVRRSFFGAGPMKSAKCSDERRMKVLRALLPIDFRFVAVAVDKSRVDPGSGLVFGEPFVKFMHRQLLDRLFAAFPDLHVVSDRYGDDDFMEGFKKYVLEKRLGHGQGDLFLKPTFEFTKSQDEPLVQLADMIAGSLSKIYDPKKRSPAKDEIHELLRGRALYVVDWPKRFRAVPQPIVGGSPHDYTVRRYCMDAVHRFLSEYEDSEDELRRAQVEVLSFLLFNFEAVNDATWVPMDRLREQLEGMGITFTSKQQLYSKVIAKLRDDGVILASSPHGYKLPRDVRDVLAFVERTDTIVVPMLNRLQNAREALLLATGGDLDIVSDERFAALREALHGRSFSDGAVPASRAG